MRVTAIMNLKGGVGKTTTTAFLGHILSQIAGKRVLLIDADSQCNLTELEEAEGAYGTLADVLSTTEIFKARGCIQPTKLGGMDILAASSDLMALDLTAISDGKVYPDTLRRTVEALRKEEAYDYVLIDCPPAFSAAGAAALMAADDVLIPIKLDAFSLRGLLNVRAQIDNMTAINPRLHIAGILPTMWYKSKQISDAEKILRDSGLPVYPHIRRSDTVDVITFTGKLLKNKRSGSEIDYKTFAVAYMGGETV